MGKFRDKHGKTRLRALIDHAREKGIELPAEVLDVAGMIFPPVNLVRKTIQMVSDLAGIDPEVKTDALNELNDIALEMEKQVTARHEVDMESDNWLSKTIRPILAIVVTLDYLATKWMPFACSIAIPDYILQATFRLMEWVMGFYLGFKGVERIAKNIGPLLKK